ncbi:glycosyltransferase family 4 protein [Novosphingobium mangrovi (ex Huang et al. 2023)]|uniref:Glycosyltransferase family 4 protein n=1 Tax=Novosphingobium mangrovi (ex Huang et al. 2023) TaxID=2976432 RepID=A0ABT2I1N8_9SPHN|nr:glycosyltransferase family 4 protein [Novosphingobium mangrovi (ex Huang et al. 2023)]MCT2398714.1 glycosyltransferase family 4 protein [Novosphingobium mangrovi (ex Huang et al. 2023)]
MVRYEPFETRRGPERVVLFHDFSQALGGASYLVQVLIGQLRARGIPVTFFSGDDGAHFHREDVEFIALHGQSLLDRSKLGAATVGLYNHSAYAVIRDWIGRNDTPGTVYHLHGWSKILTPAVFGALRAVGERTILHGHDYFNCCPNGAFFNYVTERDCRLEPLSGACLRSQCDKSSYAEKLWRAGREGLRRALLGGLANIERMLLIHPGQAGAFVAGQWPADKLFAVRNPVTPPCAERVRAEDNKGIVFIGRISPEKGADLAARAAAAAGLPITFVGEGIEEKRVRRLNPDAVLLGRLDRAGVARALSGTRLAVMPSRWSEPFGLVALEAIGSGVPVIVSDRALVAEEIARAGFGLAVDTADIAAFTSAMAELHADDARVAAMSMAGHVGYRQLCHDEGSWTDEIVDHYRSVAMAARGMAAACHREKT